VTGDQVTTVEIVIPKSINEAQRKALLEFVKASGGSIAPQEKGFFERLKEKLS
jgi:molecular chaperone DnaJ